jgi:Arc/MetJ-type ribon-helix-helix transcriptional regulator
MPRRPKAYVAALPLSALPELRELLSRFCGSEGGRGNVVMMRLSDAAVGRLDELVEAGLFGSRSEAAAFLVGAGVESQHHLFERVSKHSAEIKKVRQAMRQEALAALRDVTREPRSPEPKRKKKS